MHIEREPIIPIIPEQTARPLQTEKSGLGKSSRELELHRKAQELESLFITQIFKAMEKTIPGDGLTGSQNSMASMMFSSVMGEAVAKQGGIGLADMIYQSLSSKDEIPQLPEIPAQSYLDHLDTINLLKKIHGE